MCVTAMYAMMAAKTVGTLVAAKGARDSGRAAQQAQEFNAQIEEDNAQFALEQSAYEAMRQEARIKNLLGTQKAQYGASGVLINSGSAMSVLAQSMTEGEKDKMAIKYAGAMEAENRYKQAALSRMQGGAALKAGNTRAVGTVLTGISDTSTSYMEGKTLGYWT